MNSARKKNQFSLIFFTAFLRLIFFTGFEKNKKKSNFLIDKERIDCLMFLCIVSL